MELIITRHAKKRMVERGVNSNEIKEYIERYGYILAKNGSDGKKRFRMRKGKRMIVVVVEEIDKDKYVLITVIKERKQKIFI